MALWNLSKLITLDPLDYGIVQIPPKLQKYVAITSLIGPFTWNGGVNNQTFSRLDRFLFNEGWENHFGDVRQCVLPRPVSDHFPILLDVGGGRRGPSPFRFENMWLKMEGVKELMKSWWEGVSFNGSTSFILAEKIKVLKVKLKEWNRDSFGRIELRKNAALEQVQFWDAREKISRLNLEELEARKEAREDYKKWVLLEEISWRQKSREVWLKEGDRNTGYFHKMVNAHRRRNNVDRIKINGAWCIEENEIREGIGNAFKVLLSSSGDWRPSISGLQLGTLDQLDANTLESPFTEEEVFNALLSCNGYKAPGPDGLSMAFWQFAWDFVKADVLCFFKEFYENGKFVKSLNATFLVLIPKKVGAEDLGDFRPISLVGSLYKWLAKVLANRLKKVVGKVISKAQGAFVEGRQILDAVLIANEAIDSTLKNNESAILCKLDIEKAYDNVDWTFILTVMQKMGFGEKWIQVDKMVHIHCKFFCVGQWNPYRIFPKLKGIEIGVKGRSEEGALISHLLFVDDTLVFCKPSQDHLTHLSWLLMWFEAASGLRINLDKSELIPVGRVENMDDLAWEFGCKVGSLPSTYLGMPLGASFKSTSVWDGVEDRFRKRLGMWKRQYLSKGGRTTLIRSTLSNLPIYLMSLLCLPSVVRRRLEKIQRDFLWGGVVCLSKKKGGLGVKNLSILNKALLAKWNWRFANEREALWNQVIRGKYGEERGGWSSREVREAHGLGLWKGIRMNWELVSNRLVFIVGNGRRVRFWRDKWCGDSPLCSSFPSLFALTDDKEESVANVWDSLAEGGWGGWNPCFVRAFNDWEVEEASSFMERLHRSRVIEDVEDRVSWTETKSGKFSVKSLYLAIEAGGSARFPSSLIWNANVQPKISFFAWEATWGKALTLDKVQKRGWALANRCFLCLENEETIDHLLLHCSRTKVLWDLLFTIFGVSWVLPCSVKETLLSWNGSFVGKKRKKVCMLGLFVLLAFSCWRVYRLDGRTEGSERQKLVERFNDPLNKRVKCTLISTRAGSLGINLHSANRVIIVDGSWNPTYDLQAIYRAWRYGQTKPVFAYRLMAHGTMEEKIYKRQVTKEGLAARVVDRQQVHRTISKEEMLHLFDFGDDENPDILPERGKEEEHTTNQNMTGQVGNSLKDKLSLSHGSCSSDKLMESLLVRHYPRYILLTLTFVDVD
uniref:Helicase C-terminal domain-containing protein n=1 Tax=Vitis vinifera TaxID=29760 RepID=A5C3T6_VITVI|nr:hypothetical protein VITISV_027610 [Vitis vinifera]